MKPPWVTIVIVLVGAALSIAAVFYDTKADVKVNAAEIKHNTEDITAIQTTLSQLPDKVAKRTAEEVVKEMSK